MIQSFRVIYNYYFTLISYKVTYKKNFLLPFVSKPLVTRVGRLVLVARFKYLSAAGLRCILPDFFALIEQNLGRKQQPLVNHSPGAKFTK